MIQVSRYRHTGVEGRTDRCCSRYDSRTRTKVATSDNTVAGIVATVCKAGFTDQRINCANCSPPRILAVTCVVVLQHAFDIKTASILTAFQA